jgi:hypothetical protein
MRKNYLNNFKCTWKGNELELLTPMASNKNKHESNKNLKAMTGAINAQLPKKIVGTMVFTKMRPIPPLEMGSVTYRCTRCLWTLKRTRA